MILDISITPRQTPQPLRNSPLQHSINQTLGMSTQFSLTTLWHGPLTTYDTFEEAFLINAPFVEGGGGEEHFVD